MPQFDLSLADLESYAPAPEEPLDFDAFWHDTIAESRRAAFAPRFEPFDERLSEVIVEDVTFAGFGGHPIRGWMLRPRHASGPLPCVVSYLGHRAGRGFPVQSTAIPAAGLALFIMDSRGQGNALSPGSTTDPAGSPPRVPGVVTSGIEDPRTYYYRRLFTDAVLAVDAARSHPFVDPTRVIVSGISQGGGIALAVAALADDLAGAVIDVPFLSHFRRALRITDASPYSQITHYMQTVPGGEEDVFRVLSYFDGSNFAARATAPALFSVALADTTCPPSTVYAAYNRYAGPKEITVYPYNGHEGGQGHQLRRQLEFFAEVIDGRKAMLP
ncbi:cephalosporin-C deacetylase [Arthrobacter pigmenti]|uniref:Cephalosporin-C deacetylase n=1 Tax=Arthrobacter pigmenti TaxID=271432 RepID=A0A846RVE2_9MICC|nr:acetylxylan esterase [Arthrobacter pigmenti]NJC24452.1 cephalosporin-C deacetylase [Arthrobacter pigmenti]